MDQYSQIHYLMRHDTFLQVLALLSGARVHFQASRSDFRFQTPGT
jgi:hypothetical protein